MSIWEVIRAITFNDLINQLPRTAHFDAYIAVEKKTYIAVENVRKREIACNKQFHLFSQFFLPYMALIFHFKCTFNPFPNKPWFLRVCSRSLLKTLWDKEKLLVTSNFSFSHSVFYLFGELSAIFMKFEIVVCPLFEFGRV